MATKKQTKKVTNMKEVDKGKDAKLQQTQNNYTQRTIETKTERLHRYKETKRDTRSRMTKKRQNELKTRWTKNKMEVITGNNKEMKTQQQESLKLQRERKEKNLIQVDGNKKR